jgi:hypothetical protein
MGPPNLTDVHLAVAQEGTRMMAPKALEQGGIEKSQLAELIFKLDEMSMFSA